MPKKNPKLIFPSSTQKILKAKKAFLAMPRTKRIDLIADAGVITPEQAEQAKKKLNEAINKTATGE